MGTSELSASLWRVREALESLVFKLETERLLLTAGRARWLSRATAEVREASERVGSTGLARAVMTAELTHLGLDVDAPLRLVIAAMTSGVWSDIFEQHRVALQELITQATLLQHENERLLRVLCASQEAELDLKDAEGSHGSSMAIDLRLQHRDCLEALHVTAVAIPTALVEYVS